jgi:hypothetical protein
MHNTEIFFMVALEVATAISVIIGAAGVCLAKLFKELRKTRIRTCSCFGVNCTQDELSDVVSSEGSEEEDELTTPPTPPNSPKVRSRSVEPPIPNRVKIPDIFSKTG